MIQSNYYKQLFGGINLTPFQHHQKKYYLAMQQASFFISFQECCRLVESLNFIPGEINVEHINQFYPTNHVQQ